MSAFDFLSVATYYRDIIVLRCRYSSHVYLNQQCICKVFLIKGNARVTRDTSSTLFYNEFI